MISYGTVIERGHANHGWLDTYHTFFVRYVLRSTLHGVPSLRVINDDRVAAGRGFPTHPHRDMEIITYILDEPLNTEIAWVPVHHRPAKRSG